MGVGVHGLGIWPLIANTCEGVHLQTQFRDAGRLLLHAIACRHRDARIRPDEALLPTRTATPLGLRLKDSRVSRVAFGHVLRHRCTELKLSSRIRRADVTAATSITCETFHCTQLQAYVWVPRLPNTRLPSFRVPSKTPHVLPRCMDLFVSEKPSDCARRQPVQSGTCINMLEKDCLFEAPGLK